MEICLRDCVQYIYIYIYIYMNIYYINTHIYVCVFTIYVYVNYIYIYIYIFIYMDISYKNVHSSTDKLFRLSKFISMVRHARCFTPGIKTHLTLHQANTITSQPVAGEFNVCELTSVSLHIRLSVTEMHSSLEELFLTRIYIYIYIYT